jgi:hypothetical protein
MRFNFVSSIATSLIATFAQASPAAILRISFLSAAAIATALQILFRRRTGARCPKPPTPTSGSRSSGDGKAFGPRLNGRMNNW